MMLRPLSILLLCANMGFSLDSITCQVCPGKNPPGGMGKVVTGMARLTITIGSSCSDKYIKPEPSITGDPTVMWNGPSSSGGKCPKTWWWDLVVDHPNDDIHAVFDGVMPTCGGSGGTGGSSEPPKFSGNIVHIDLDVDSDRDSRTCQHPPSRSDDEDAAEDSHPSLIMCMNTGHDEEGAWPDNDDWKKDGIDPTDIDLFQAVFEVIGSDGLATFNYPAYIKLYKANGSLLASGTAYSFSEGIHDLLIEGIDYGKGKISVTFFPTNGHGNAADDVAFEVKQEERLVIGVTGAGDPPSGPWEFAKAGGGPGSTEVMNNRWLLLAPNNPDVVGRPHFPHSTQHFRAQHSSRSGRRSGIAEIDNWMSSDYTRGGTENRNIIVASNSWGAANGDAFVQHYKDTYCKHPRARVIVEGIAKPLSRYSKIGPAVHRLNYYSDEKTWVWSRHRPPQWRQTKYIPQGQYIEDALLNRGYNIELDFDAGVRVRQRNIIDVKPSPETPKMYWGNRFRPNNDGTWRELDFPHDIHILTEWVGTREGFEKVDELLASKP